MSKVNTMEQDNIYVRYTIIIVGITIMSIGVNGFLRQAHLLSGGVAGISTGINYLTNINVGLITLLINIPIFILGFIYLEKDFLITSLANMVLFSFIIGITQEVGNVIPIDDILLQSVYGGILCGIGNGLVFRTKSSLGGTDIIGAILKNKLNIAIKNTAFGLNLALYTLIAMFLNAQVMNYIKDALNDEKAVMVFSNNSHQIAKDIMQTLVRGVTFLEAEGGYTNEKKKIIYCVVLSREIPKIKEITLKHDEKAFISVNDINEVKGRGFKEKFL